MAEKPKPCRSIGIQWGFWYWSESQYAWIGGTGAGIPPPPPPPPPEVEMEDNFNDNSLDPSKWTIRKFEKAEKIEIYERNQRLEIALSADDPDVSPKAGVRTTNAFDTSGKTVIADLYTPNVQNFARNWLMITPEDIPNDIGKHPLQWAKDNNKQLYSIITRTNGAFGIKVSGGVETVLGGIEFTSGAWIGKIRVVRTGLSIFLQVYKDGSWQTIGEELCMFAGDAQLYVYLWSEDNWARSVVHGEPDAWFDNFSIG